MKLLSSVGRKNEEDVRHKQNGMKKKKSAARRKLLKTEWVELLLKSVSSEPQGHVILGRAG